MKLCLNMIVKNESGRIERALASVVQFIEGAVIVDTGSTDGTQALIEKFFEAHKLPVYVESAPFENWSQARNEALVSARRLAPTMDADYILLMDADMEIVVKDVSVFLAPRDGASYDLYQEAGSLKYQNRRLVHAAVSGQYRGVTHEYLDIPTAGCITPDVAYFVDHADGANRPDKYKRDIRLLLKDLKGDPNNARSMFYLANSYRDAGQPVRASLWYQRRVEAGGWDEEVWQAEVYLAHCYKDMNREGDFIRTLLSAYNRRPTRAEPMYDLARYYRDKGMNAPALACAEAVAHLPPSTDALFVNDWVYQAGIKEELSINAFYVPGKMAKGFDVTEKLSLQAGPYGGARELARSNLWHYIRPLSDHIGSFEWKKIDFTPPVDWVAMNPSVTLCNDALYCNVRCVNYRIDEHGRYLIKATDGTANDANPINTRNFVVRLDETYWNQPLKQWEVLPPPELPCEFKAVIGFEDMRIFAMRNDTQPAWTDAGLWSSATVRQIHPDGNCEQVLTKLKWYDETHLIHTDEHRMLRTPRSTEKNWAPLPRGNKVDFMWRPGELVNSDGETIVKHAHPLATDHISGSSQLIRWMGQYLLGITHEARTIPGSHLRWYYHRFAKYAANGALISLSKPFFFNEKGIEFCAGMCWHSDGTHVMISYGFKDEEARIARVHYMDLGEFLCQ